MIYKLSQIMEIIGGGTPKTTNSDYWGGNIPWISVKDFNNDNKYVYETEKTITKLGLENSSTKLLLKDDIIISARGTVGEIAMIPYQMAFNQSCYGLRAKDKVSKEFLYYLIKFKIKELKHNTHGSVFDTITKETFDKIIVDIPDFNTQEEIANILSSIDDKIELNNKINENLEQQAQAIYKSWFVDFEPWNGVMPEDWEIRSIRDIADNIICGKTPSTQKIEYFGGTIPFITIPDMHDNVYVIKTQRTLTNKGAESQGGKLIPSNSICVSCIGTAGLVSLVSKESQTNQQINSIIPKIDISSYFVYLSMKGLSKKINSFGQSGSTIVNMNKSQFEKMEILCPSINIMKKFHNIVKDMFNDIKLKQLENQRLSELRDSLLPKLMSGEIDVENIEL